MDGVKHATGGNVQGSPALLLSSLKISVAARRPRCRFDFVAGIQSPATRTSAFAPVALQEDPSPLAPKYSIISLPVCCPHQLACFMNSFIARSKSQRENHDAKPDTIVEEEDLHGMLPAKISASPNADLFSVPISPLHTVSSVPFSWEEFPGKPRQCTEVRHQNTEPSLQLPPRLQVYSKACDSPRRSMNTAEQSPFEFSASPKTRFKGKSASIGGLEDIRRNERCRSVSCVSPLMPSQETLACDCPEETSGTGEHIASAESECRISSPLTGSGSDSSESEGAQSSFAGLSSSEAGSSERIEGGRKEEAEAEMSTVKKSLVRSWSKMREWRSSLRRQQSRGISLLSFRQRPFFRLLQNGFRKRAPPAPSSAGPSSRILTP